MKKTKKIKYKKSDTIVISDLHLGSSSSQTSKLYLFLKELLKNPPKRLVINGDAFELWSTNYRKIGPHEYRVVRKVLELSQNGTKIVYIPGNHDRAFRMFKKFTFGKIKVRNEYVIKNNNKRFLVIHGDEFDKFTRNHIILSLIIDQFYVYIVKISAFLKRFFGFRFSLATTKRNSEKFQKIIQEIKRASLLYARSRNMDGIIIGHAHWPEVFESIDGTFYANSGDWTENMSYIVVGEEIKLEIFK